MGDNGQHMINSAVVRAYSQYPGAEGKLIRRLVVDHTAALRAKSTLHAIVRDALPALSLPQGGSRITKPCWPIGGNDSDSRRQDLLIHGILPVIPSRKGRGAPSQQTGKAIWTALGPL